MISISIASQLIRVIGVTRILEVSGSTCRAIWRDGVAPYSIESPAKPEASEERSPPPVPCILGYTHGAFLLSIGQRWVLRMLRSSSYKWQPPLPSHYHAKSSVEQTPTYPSPSYFLSGSISMISFVLAPWELLLLILANLFSRATGMMLGPRSSMAFDSCYCLSWRFAVEANNAQAWRMVPPQCVLYVEHYMLAGQYNIDIDMVMEEISTYLNGIVAADDGMDAWILDIDDTCLSNLWYYEGKRFGGDPWDPSTFKGWAQKGICPAIPSVLRLYNRLIKGGFKVFLLTGRDEEALGASTAQNLHAQGFIGYERLILRGPSYRGQRAVVFKSAVRKQLVEEGYRILGNVGDQWSDLQGDCTGDRIFKIPNPMYFVP